MQPPKLSLKSPVPTGLYYTRVKMCLQILMLILLIGKSLGFELFENQKRQQLYPFPRIGRGGSWTFVEEKRPGGLKPFPRVGRGNDGKRQGLIPFPRIGRSLMDEDYDFNEFTFPDFDDWVPEDDNDNHYDFFPVIYKRARLAPRVGRKKRSVDLEEGPEENKSQTINLNQTPDWQADMVNFEPFDNPFYFRQNQQGISFPRTSRASFIPRVGKKRSEFQYNADNNDKRAVFAPRVGRRALIPRIGRSDPSIKTRAALMPRIGRAVFAPRIGRSEITESIDSSTPAN